MKYPNDFINQIICGDCLTEHTKIKNGSVDLILTDLPYGNMNGINNPQRPKSWGNPEYLKWDKALPINKIYEIANRILRKNGKMILFSQEPYTSKLITQVIENLPFSYRMIWQKNDFANALLCNKSPVSYFEDILVFSKKYDMEAIHPLRGYALEIKNLLPIKYSRKAFKEKFGHYGFNHFLECEEKNTQFNLCTEESYNQLIKVFRIDKMEGFKNFEDLRVIDRKYDSTFNLWEGKKYKSNILKYKKDYKGYHPTQKPILLLEDLIKTFSNKGDLVVDLTAGSGSTGVACANTNRNYILIEKEEKYIDISRDRINAIPELLFV